MKIRNGFVSNSSSSSFVILGVAQKGDYDEYEELMEKSNFESLYVEEKDYDYIVGYVISDDEELDFTKTSLKTLQEKAQEISTSLKVDISEVKLYTGIRPC